MKIGHERLTQIPHQNKIMFQRTSTWKESKDPDREAKLNTTHFLDRWFAFGQLGPLSIRPCHGRTWTEQGNPDRLLATYHAPTAFGPATPPS